MVDEFIANETTTTKRETKNMKYRMTIPLVSYSSQVVEVELSDDAKVEDWTLEELLEVTDNYNSISKNGIRYEVNDMVLEEKAIDYLLDI